MKKSLRLKLLSMFVFSLAVALSVSFIIHTLYLRPYYLKHTEERMLAVVDLVVSHIDDVDLLASLEQIDIAKQVDIIVADQNLRNVNASYNLNRSGEAPLERLDREIHSLVSNNHELLETEHIFETVHSDIPRLILVESLSDGSFCIIIHPLESLESNIEAMGSFHYVTGGIACLLSVCVTFFFSKTFTKPIIQISKVTEAMSQLDFTQKIDYHSQDELGDLAISINRLSEKLEANGTALKNEIAFQKVLSQNMSHELKTPISVIKGYIEALTFGIAEDKETQEEYMSIVLRECDRMNELISQMLHLSKLNSYEGGMLEKELIDPNAFIQRMEAQSAGVRSQKQIPFTSYVQSEQPLLAHPDLLEQGISNYLTNAVKYGDGKEIRMSVVEEETCHRISVFNSGDCLPVSEEKKVFDVFYMVDKVRSRENNSHGLGLSVTKTIAELHQGSAECKGTEGGMIFFIKIPKSQEITPKLHKNKVK